MIRILLADDHPTLLLGLRMLLAQEADVEVVGEAGTGTAALHLIERLQPDVAVLDCQLPDRSGVAVADEVHQRGLPTRVLALSAYDDKHYVRGMLAAGARGYLMKEDAPHEIVAAVRAVAQGKQWVSDRVQPHLEATVPPDETTPKGLTAREREVLLLLAAGQTNRAIGCALGISEKTVEKHIAALFDKLGATSRVEVATLAMQAGLLEEA